jgi:hypothetical protein
MRSTQLRKDRHAAPLDPARDVDVKQLLVYEQYLGALQQAAILNHSDSLHQPPNALSIRNNRRTIQDGPFAETKEQLGC